MESFLRRKLAQASGNILSGSSLQKPVSSYQPIKLPDLCSSYYSVADEPLPQVSGFLDDTVGPSFLLNETGLLLNSPTCMPSEIQAKNKDEGVLAPKKEATNDSSLNCSLGGHCQLANGSMSTKLPQNEKDITTATAGKADGDCNDATVSTTSLEKSDLISGELKNSTFDVSHDSKERSDAGINATVDLHNIIEKNSTFESQEPRLNSTVDIDVPNTKTESGNTTVELVQSHDHKEGPDTGVNATVDISNLDGTQSKTNSCVDSTVPLNTTTEQPNEKLEGTIDIQPQEKPYSSFNSEVDTVKNSDKAHLKVNVTVEIVEQTASAPLQPSGEAEQSNSPPIKPADAIQQNTTTNLTLPEVLVLKDTTLEIKPSSTALHDQVNDASNSVGVIKPASNSRESEVEINTTAFVCSVNAPDDAPELKAEEHHKKPSSPGLADAESIPSSDMGNISRNSIFCLDDTLDMKTSFLVTSTPIVFGKESRFEIMRDMKPRKRLSVINSIEAQSNDELVCASNHDGTDAVQATESSSQSQKVSATCALTPSASEPANENRPTTKLPIKRQLPQLSSKLSYPKSSLPPRPQLSVNSSVAVKPKTLPGPSALQQPDASSTALPGSRKTVQMNKGKNIAPVKNIASANTVKIPMVSAVTGCNLAAAKPSSSGIQQMRPSGLPPPTRKRLALKTPQTSRPPVETVQTQPSNKSTVLSGMRTRSSLLPSVGQKHLNNDGLPSAKRKRIAPALSTVESNALHAAEGAHEPGCVNCLQHQEKLERVMQELMGLRSECKNWGPLHEKLEMCVEELKRI